MLISSNNIDASSVLFFSYTVSELLARCSHSVASIIVATGAAEDDDNEAHLPGITD